jgi:hypothetical protein
MAIAFYIGRDGEQLWFPHRSPTMFKTNNLIDKLSFVLAKGQ